MTTFDTLYAARWRAVGTSFLRRRPVIVAVGAAGNAALALASGAPRAQVAMLGAVTGTMVLAFAIEAWRLGRRALDERWLAASLLLTALAIGASAAISGGLESPMVPLLFAPVTVGLAAFGRARGSALLGVTAIVIVVVLAIVPWPLPPLPAPWRGWMVGWGVLVSFALVALGVIGLVESSRTTGQALDRMRGDLLDEAARRAREQEHLGAKVAHEIRNPLTAVKGLVQILSKKADGERDARRFEVALSEVERVERILDEYLSLARPLTDLVPEPIATRALIDDVSAIVEGRAAASGVRVTCEGEGGTLIADPRRLREALLNIAQNAIQAMPRGGALVLSAGRELRGGDEHVALVVRDEGDGMPPEMLARAGTPFVSGREGGTGLGLALAKSVAQQHGGELTIDSAPGAGTTVRITLPAQPPGRRAESETS